MCGQGLAKPFSVEKGTFFGVSRNVWAKMWKAGKNIFRPPIRAASYRSNSTIITFHLARSLARPNSASFSRLDTCPCPACATVRETSHFSPPFPSPVRCTQPPKSSSNPFRDLRTAYKHLPCLFAAPDLYSHLTTTPCSCSET